MNDILQKGQYCSPKDQEGHLPEGLLYLAEGLLYLTEGLLYLTEGLMYLAEGGPKNGHPIEVLLLGLETPGDPEVLLSV